MQEECIRV